ncbi:MAG: BatD family protein, partial [candidate division Zixibacteria bacterium]
MKSKTKPSKFSPALFTFAAALSIIFLLSNATVLAIGLSQSISKTEMKFEDSLIFEIRLEWAGSQFAYLFEGPLNPYFDRLRVGNFSSSINSTGTGDDEKTIKEFSYTLLPTSSGTARIDPIVISFLSLPDSARGQLLTEPVIINVADPVIVEESESFSLWLLATGGFFLIGGLAVAFLLIKNGGKKEVFTPVQIALQELSKVKEDSGTDFKKFQAGVYRLLTKFSKENYRIETAEKSEAEIETAFA